MNTKAAEPEPSIPDGMATAVRQQRERQQGRLKEGEPSVVRFVGQIDHKFGTGIFWSAPLLVFGVVVGFWSAWRWMHKQ